MTDSNNRGRSNSIDIPHSDFSDTTNETKPVSFSDGITIAIRSMSYCSRFDGCNANRCPLDPLGEYRDKIPEDDPCEMAKATRHAYWLSMPADLKAALPNQGYFRSELNRIHAARDRWQSMDPEKKAALIESGKAALSRSLQNRKDKVKENEVGNR